MPTHITRATGALVLLLAITSPAMADAWPISFDRTVAVGGEAWAGPSGPVLTYPRPSWAALGFEYLYSGGTPTQSGTVLGGTIARYSGWFGLGSDRRSDLGPLPQGRWSVRVDLKSEVLCSSTGTCSWSTDRRAASFRVDTTAPSSPDILSPQSGTTVGSDTALEWARAIDAHTGVSHYVVTLGDTQIAEVSAAACSTTCTLALRPNQLPDGPHTVRIDAIDLVGNVVSAGPLGFGISDTPMVSLVQPPAFVMKGQTVTLRASGSIANASPLTYTWDTDGSGDFATNTGDVPELSITPTGPTTVRVRATAPGGGVATAKARIDTRKKAQSDDPGVSINDGARFTRDTTVALSLVWPDGATTMRVATDGGFRGAAVVPIDDTAEVTLDGDSNSLLPHLVYVRFAGPGIDARETFTDDIILDTVAPVVESVSATQMSVGAKPLVRVRVRARDAVSGVKSIGIATSRRAVVRTVAFAPSTTTRFAGRVMWVRAFDSAGNTSDWRRVPIR